MLIPANWVPEPTGGGDALADALADVVTVDVAVALVVLVTIPVAGTH